MKLLVFVCNLKHFHKNLFFKLTLIFLYNSHYFVTLINDSQFHLLFIYLFKLLFCNHCLINALVGLQFLKVITLYAPDLINVYILIQGHRERKLEAESLNEGMACF